MSHTIKIASKSTPIAVSSPAPVDRSPAHHAQEPHRTPLGTTATNEKNPTFAGVCQISEAVMLRASTLETPLGLPHQIAAPV
jgi:hypothetical protein